MLKKLSYILLSALALTSCSDTLDDINKNPNATETPLAPFLLTGTLKQGADLYWGSDNNFNSSLLFVQHWAKVQYTEPDRYDVSNNSFTYLWNAGYSTLITDLNTILNFPDQQANSNYKGIALTLRSWTFLLLTDAYGSIPYKEAGLKVTPAYNTQKEVYTGLLEDLKRAQSLLATTNGTVTGDLAYKGNIAKWKKLVNSLRLRIALRISDREPALAKQAAIEATTDAAGLISSNSEIFQFVYTSSPQQNPASAWFETRDDFRISKTVVDKLKELSDPRLPVYAQLPSDASVGKYVGGANGLSNSDANSQGFAKTSKPGSYFLTSASPAILVSYSEVLFNLSEAAARGYIAGDAEQLYKSAITASFNQFGITNATIISDYLDQPIVKYDAANYAKSIGTQKWIAFFGQGLDAFAEWRRLDYPALTAGPATVLDGQLPSRFFYPGTEQSLNGTSYQAAVAAQGKDLLTTKLWFDTK
ncbi:SusD/RagB family nutrient-binding outer membrane lipoprotein [Flavobacterium sp. Fl-318]|uniref:SusD/RagB family nutrient-binding outer membrane lipoprotein n=1 Tax=Flavobacterium cupriresistens TaxID=2893885 RepID=A0ABU4RFN0_9FLAO|nr:MULTISPECIES: SusD/RagB family nutrient-binding outer membrane lipoprotein [unclassified Flavobacterium]MDX6189316.1 SusD/RagB family nutrient-binding outer membrane lipoprotein [Flavobacterium sp. Fl-318]UFH41411.1 SusD/RagB family nutrient-binding outer membrane lipoprotein [Flavobacterium sp. F-323]